MAYFIKDKKPHKLLVYLLLMLPFLFGIAYMIGFNTKAHAAVTRDTVSNSVGAAVGSVSWQHTINDNPNRILIVGVTTVSIGSAQPSSVTFNGIPLKNASSSNCYLGLACNATMWYLVNPPIGTYTISASFSGFGLEAGAASYYNVDTTNPFSKITTGAGTTSSTNYNTNMTVAGTTSSDVLVDVIAAAWSGCGGTSTVTAVSPQSSAWQLYDNTGSNCLINAGSSKQGSAGSTSLSWNIRRGSTGTLSWGGIAAMLNPPPAPTPTPTPTPTAIPTPKPTPAPIVGNITNLNFGISNSSPWIQVTCGDLRMDGGVTNAAPAGQNMITTNATCASPGLVFTGGTTATFGQGQASSSNQVVGGATYPEVYSPPGAGGIFSSYSSLLAKAQSSTTTPVNLSTVCTLSSCTLPANLPHGVYVANGDVVLNTYSFSANANYIFLVNGNLTLNGNIIAPPGSNSSVLFSASGNIIVPATVGSAPGVTTANLSGIFSTDKSFIMQSSGNCTDLRLNIEGTLIVNAGRTGGSLQNNRDLCGSNATSPTLALTQRLDFILNLPDFAKEQSVTSQEVAP